MENFQLHFVHHEFSSYFITLRWTPHANLLGKKKQLNSLEKNRLYSPPAGTRIREEKNIFCFSTCIRMANVAAKTTDIHHQRDYQFEKYADGTLLSLGLRSPANGNGRFCVVLKLLSSLHYDKSHIIHLNEFKTQRQII